jgi:hypothetical protein
MVLAMMVVMVALHLGPSGSNVATQGRRGARLGQGAIATAHEIGSSSGPGLGSAEELLGPSSLRRIQAQVAKPARSI